MYHRCLGYKRRYVSMRDQPAHAKNDRLLSTARQALACDHSGDSNQEPAAQAGDDVGFSHIARA
jgi:hypothetical protein